MLAPGSAGRLIGVPPRDGAVHRDGPADPDGEPGLDRPLPRGGAGDRGAELERAAGASGSFDLVLINTNATGGTSYDVAADSLDIALSGTAGVTITDVTMSTSSNYIFMYAP